MQHRTGLLKKVMAVSMAITMFLSFNVGVYAAESGNKPDEADISGGVVIGDTYVGTYTSIGGASGYSVLLQKVVAQALASGDVKPDDLPLPVYIASQNSDGSVTYYDVQESGNPEAPDFSWEDDVKQYWDGETGSIAPYEPEEPAVPEIAAEDATPEVGATGIAITGTGFKTTAALADFLIGGAASVKVTAATADSEKVTFTTTALAIGDVIEITAKASAFESAGADSNKVTFSVPTPGATTLTGVTVSSNATPAIVGSVLTAAPVYDGEAPENPTLTYQWYGDDVAIDKADKNTYTVIAADQGKAITVKVTASGTAVGEATSEAINIGAARLSHNIANDSYSMPDLDAGYTSTDPNLKPLDIEVTAAGSHTELEVTVDQPEVTVDSQTKKLPFTVTDISTATLADGGKAKFTVTTNTKLAAGTYTATITVKSSEDTAGVSFTVTQIVKPEGGTLTTDVPNGVLKFKDLPFGYAETDAETLMVTVTAGSGRNHTNVTITPEDGTGANVPVFTVTPASAPLAAGESVTFTMNVKKDAAVTSDPANYPGVGYKVTSVEYTDGAKFKAVQIITKAKVAQVTETSVDKRGVVYWTAPADKNVNRLTVYFTETGKELNTKDDIKFENIEPSDGLLNFLSTTNKAKFDGVKKDTTYDVSVVSTVADVSASNYDNSDPVAAGTWFYDYISAVDTIELVAGAKGVTLKDSTLTVDAGTTVEMLLAAIKATDDSKQGYVVKNSAGTAIDGGPITGTGNKLSVTPENGGTAKEYTITVDNVAVTLSVEPKELTDPLGTITVKLSSAIKGLKADAFKVTLGDSTNWTEGEQYGLTLTPVGNTADGVTGATIKVNAAAGLMNNSGDIKVTVTAPAEHTIAPESVAVTNKIPAQPSVIELLTDRTDEIQTQVEDAWEMEGWTAVDSAIDGYTFKNGVFTADGSLTRTTVNAFYPWYETAYFYAFAFEVPSKSAVVKVKSLDGDMDENGKATEWKASTGSDFTEEGEDESAKYYFDSIHRFEELDGATVSLLVDFDGDGKVYDETVYTIDLSGVTAKTKDTITTNLEAKLASFEKAVAETNFVGTSGVEETDSLSSNPTIESVIAAWEKGNPGYKADFYIYGQDDDPDSESPDREDHGVIVKVAKSATTETEGYAWVVLSVTAGSLDIAPYNTVASDWMEIIIAKITADNGDTGQTIENITEFVEESEQIESVETAEE